MTTASPSATMYHVFLLPSLCLPASPLQTQNLPTDGDSLPHQRGLYGLSPKQTSPAFPESYYVLQLDQSL